MQEAGRSTSRHIDSCLSGRSRGITIMRGSMREGSMVAFGGANVVVTGGTGALGTAVVTRLRMAGAVCHVTNLVAAELAAYAHRNDPAVHIHSGVDLADDAAVRDFYAALPPLWASVHLAGGFAMAPAAETVEVDFMAQFRMNALSAFLCSAAAVRAIRARSEAGPGGAHRRAHRQCRGAPRRWNHGSAPAWLRLHRIEGSVVAAC